jgi:c-di-GMP-binding flagellar brake protein YcgR
VKMDDHIRDEIVRFVFEREREILREKRQAE